MGRKPKPYNGLFSLVERFAKSPGSRRQRNAMAEDYYKVLGVPRNASQEEIQKAYRELARKYHPDLHPHDKQAKKKFQKVQAAFDVLSNVQKREMYDRYGSSFETAGGGPRGGAAWGPEGMPPGGFTFDDIDFGQFFGQRPGSSASGGFEDLFGQFTRGTARTTPRGRPKRRRGADVRQEITVPFATAVSGGQAQIEVRRRTGKTDRIAVTIPAGVEDGKKIRLRGQGEPGSRGGPAGDILLTVRVAPHPCFRRHGNQLHVTLPVTLAEAVLGAKVDVPTPQGEVALTIPPGTSGGTRLRIKSHGVRSKTGPAGDLIAEVQIVLPKQIDAEVREAVQRWGRRQTENPRAKLRW